MKLSVWLFWLSRWSKQEGQKSLRVFNYLLYALQKYVILFGGLTCAADNPMMQPNTKFDHDVFVSYAEGDSDWVKGYLLPSIGLVKPQVFLQDDFQLGELLGNEFERAVTKSRITLLILSPSYLANQWTLFGEALATYASVEENVTRLIPLVITPVELPLRLRFRVQLDCVNQENWPEAMGRLRSLLGRPEPVAEELVCPYPGMLPYSEANAARYYGREELVQTTVESLRLKRLLTIIGPSGSGKTSFLYAGLIPRLSKSRLFPTTEWHVLSLRPGAQPLHKLAGLFSQYISKESVQILAELEENPAACIHYFEQVSSSKGAEDNWVLIIDQFEEIFAQCKQPPEKQQFFEGLRKTCASIPERWRFILSVRADFYADCQESILWEDIEASLLNLPPLSRAELRRAIVEPAKNMGVFLEAALVERLIDDAEGQKGPLPLLQETLVLMWSRYLHQRLLTLADYEALGTNDLTGLDVAMWKWADSSLAELHQENQRAITRRIFLRLIEFGAGRNDTRRQQTMDDLYTVDDEKTAVQTVLEYLVAHRLITVGHDDVTGLPLVDLAHEKLIESWPQLRDWLEAYHTMEAERRSLVLSATTWRENKQDKSFLFTGERLKKATGWAEQWGQELGALEQEYLSASQKWDRQIRRQRWIMISAISIVALSVFAIVGSLGWRALIRQQTGSPLIGVDAGEAIVGSDDPQQADHKVTLLAYHIEKFEVSNTQYKACEIYGPCEPPINRDDYDKSEKQKLPVVWVTAKQANTYCQWLGRRLPTSVEWERAVRGTDGRQWPWGDSLFPKEGFTPPEEIVPVDSVPETATLAPPEPIYHLMDNVSEWVVRVKPGCQKEECHVAWDGKTDLIAYGGGAYDRFIERAAAITNSGPANPDPSIGFRCVADLQP